jgi:uncharacterized protein YdgA (DUF945 family)
MAAVVVLGAVALGGAFCLAWLLRPDLRARIERPTQDFQANVQAYDRSQRARSDIEGGAK